MIRPFATALLDHGPDLFDLTGCAGRIGLGACHLRFRLARVYYSRHIALLHLTFTDAHYDYPSRHLGCDVDLVSLRPPVAGGKSVWQTTRLAIPDISAD